MDSSAGMSTGFVTLTPVAFRDLPEARPGMIVCIADSAVNTWGRAIVGGGSYTVLGFYNGATWTVLAI